LHKTYAKKKMQWSKTRYLLPVILSGSTPELLLRRDTSEESPCRNETPSTTLRTGSSLDFRRNALHGTDPLRACPECSEGVTIASFAVLRKNLRGPSCAFVDRFFIRLAPDHGSRLNQSSESVPATSNITIAAAVKRAVISVCCFLNTNWVLRFS